MAIYMIQWSLSMNEIIFKVLEIMLTYAFDIQPSRNTQTLVYSNCKEFYLTTYFSETKIFWLLRNTWTLYLQRLVKYNKAPEFWILFFYTAAAKSFQSCLTLCDPIDSSPPGSSVPGILQARILEWVAISSGYFNVND